MSLANVMVERDRVRIVTDTLAYNAAGEPLGLVQAKVHSAPEQRFAYSVRGSMADALGAEAGLAFFTEMAAADDWMAQNGPYIAWPERSSGSKGTDIVLAGPLADGSMSAVRYCWAENGTFSRTELAGGLHLYPAGDRHRYPVSGATDDQLIKAAMAQFQTFQKHGIGMCVGGVLHITEITPAGVSTRIAGLFPDYDAMCDLLPDPNAEAVEAFRAAAGVKAA